jgi:LysR family transcriptional activator of nhaA
VRATVAVDAGGTGGLFFILPRTGYFCRVPQLNYNHLHYFWVVARKGSIARAAETLYLTPQTISGQLRTLEETLDTRLFRKQGRGLALTDSGALLFQYADEMFRIGTELESAIAGRASAGALSLKVGVADAVPKLIAYRLLEPALGLREPVRLAIQEGGFDELLAQLAVHRLDVVIADGPIAPGASVRAYSHPLGECGVSFFAAPSLAKGLARGVPRALHEAPWLAPAAGTPLRRALEAYFEETGVRPRLVAEFQDSALLKTFACAGHGVFAAPSAIEREIRSQYGVSTIGRTDRIRERFYAISAERRLKHPAVVAISAAAHDHIFRR